MTSKDIFIEVVTKLFNESNEVPMEAKTYLESLKIEKPKKEITEKGAIILKFLQRRPGELFSSKMMSEEIGINSKTIAGSLRKLTSDGFVSKVGQNPTMYSIATKGIEYKFDNE